MQTSSCEHFTITATPVTMYNYYAIVHVETERLHNVKEIVNFSVLFLDSTFKVVHTFDSPVKPRIVGDYYDRLIYQSPYERTDYFSSVLKRFKETFGGLLERDDVLYITIGNQPLYSIIPSQCLIEESYTKENVSNIFQPRRWCNLLWVFEKVTNVRLSFDTDTHAEINDMWKHLDLPKTCVIPPRDSDDYCQAVARIMEVLAQKNNITSYDATCRVLEDECGMMTKLRLLHHSWSKGMSFVRM